MDVKQYHNRICLFLKLHSIVVIILGALAAFAVFALVHLLLLEDGIARNHLFAFAWTTFGLVIISAGFASYRALAGRNKTAEIRSIMLKLFPAQRKDLAAWLSPELLGKDSKSTRELLQLRLNRTLPAKAVFWLIEGSLAHFFFLCLSVIFICFMMFTAVGKRAIDRYVRQLLTLNHAQTLSLQVKAPEWQWLPADKPTKLLFSFNRKPFGPVVVKLIQEHNQLTIFNRILTEKELSCWLPPQAESCHVQVLAEQKESSLLPFYVFPDNPLSIEAIELRSREGAIIKKVQSPRFPLQIATGSRLVFVIDRKDCPLAELGISGRIHGNLPIRKTSGRSNFYKAEAVITASDEFSLFWQFPNHIFGKSKEFRIIAKPDEPPKVHLEQPEDKAQFEKNFSSVQVKGLATDDGLLEQAVVQYTDFYQLANSATATAEALGNGQFRLGADISTESLAHRQGAVLGLCLSVADNASQVQSANSEIAMVLLPLSAKELTAEMEKFWQQDAYEKVPNDSQTDGEEFAKNLEQALKLTEAVRDSSRHEKESASSEASQVSDADENERVASQPEKRHQQPNAQEATEAARTSAKQDEFQAENLQPEASQREKKDSPSAEAKQDQVARSPTSPEANKKTTKTPCDESNAEAGSKGAQSPGAAVASKCGSTPSTAHSAEVTEGEEKDAASGKDDSATKEGSGITASTDGRAAQQKAQALGGRAEQDNAGHPQAEPAPEQVATDEFPIASSNKQVPEDSKSTEIDAASNESKLDNELEITHGKAKASANENVEEYAAPENEGLAATTTEPAVSEPAESAGSRPTLPAEAVSSEQSLPLQATEWEEQLEKYRAVREQLTPNEKRLVREYYRLLRDIQ